MRRLEPKPLHQINQNKIYTCNAISLYKKICNLKGGFMHRPSQGRFQKSDGWGGGGGKSGIGMGENQIPPTGWINA